MALALISGGDAFELAPKNPQPGDLLTIRGSAPPGEEVRLRSSFEMELPAEGGRYEYVAEGVEIPRRPNRLSVVAEEVEELKLGVKMGIWITVPVSTRDGVASFSRSDVPPGSYTLKIFGKALPGSDLVEIRVDAETAVLADSDGEYQLAMETSGVPEGEYRIRVGGEEQVVVIGKAPAEARSESSRSEPSGGKRTDKDLPAPGREVEKGAAEIAIPDPYYREMKRADAENPDDIVRYVSSARNRALGLDVFERAAFYEHYLRGCGFNVSFAYSDRFDEGGRDHLWLLVTTRKGVVIEVDPSYRQVGGSSLLPLDPAYSRYEERFADVYEAAETLGVERLAWWADEAVGGAPPAADLSRRSEGAVNVSAGPVEEGGFISGVCDLLRRALGKIGQRIPGTRLS